MSNNIEKKVKALISGIIVNDESKINKLVQELTESILPERTEKIMKMLSDDFRRERNV
jgi:hypothetical protein